MKWNSLYWRIAAGFVAALALLLFVQGMLFVWVVARSGSSVPNQPPDRQAQTIALDVTQLLSRDPSADIEAYIRQEYERDAQPFFVVLANGRTIEFGGPFPAGLVEDGRRRLLFRERVAEDRRERGSIPVPPPVGPRGMFGPRGGRVAPGGPETAGAFRQARPAAIVADGKVVGLVVVPVRPPFRFLLARYGPILGFVALTTLVVGGLLVTAVVFGPARRRLLAVEDAARRLGSGDLTARAPTSGRDEVAAVALAFNSMADDLSARANALASSDRARRQLLADVSHELTTPVTAMRGYLETLTMPELALDDGTRARYLQIVADETARLERIIGDLLDLARLEGGGAPFTIGDISVTELFARVAARHERWAADANVSIRTAVDADAEVVRGDRDRIEQALQNLTANALRYAPSGTAIELRARRDADAVAITVTDSGAGIPIEHLPHIFDRFYKAETSRAVRPGNGVAGGSGLGLSIVKAIVEQHGGSVSVESRPGRTVFQVRLGPST